MNTRQIFGAGGGGLADGSCHFTTAAEEGAVREAAAETWLGLVAVSSHHVFSSARNLFTLFRLSVASGERSQLCWFQSFAFHPGLRRSSISSSVAKR